MISMLGRNTGAEPPRHGDCARVEVTRCQGPNQGGEVYPAHWEVACKYLSAALVLLVQTKFNKSFRQVFASHLPERWIHFIPLIRTLTTGHFHPGTVTMPGGFCPIIPPQHCNHSGTTKYSSPAPQKTTSSATRRRRLHTLATGSDTKSRTSPSLPIWTRVPPAAVYG